MAKGSGGVGKSKGKASVSGVAPKAPAAPKASFGPGDISPANLAKAAAALPASDKFHGRAFLGPLMSQFGTTPQAAKDKLWELHQDGKITLSRADLVEAMNPRTVAASELTHRNAMFHLIEFD